MRKIIIFASVFFMFFATACGAESGNQPDPADGNAVPEADSGNAKEQPMKISITINGKDKLSATLSDNSSAAAFYELLSKGDVTVNMHDYGNFEKVGNLPHSLPRNDTQITTRPGDIILYQGDQITIYYDVNSWNFTLLGRVDGKTQQELKTILGEGDVTAVFAVAVAEKTMKLPTVKLNSGYEMPLLGLGTWALSGKTAEDAVYTALKAGYRLIDTAKYYGNEAEVGKALGRAVKDGICKREEVFVTTKLVPWSDNPDADIDDSLKKLGVSYIDLVLLHQHGSNDDTVYKAMVKAVKNGKIRSVGISNFYKEESVSRFINDFEIPPAVVQNENHLFYQNNTLRDRVKKQKIYVESWYPFGGRSHAKEHLKNPAVLKIAESHKKTAAQIIVRWHIQAGYIVIPGSGDAAHIKENYDILDFELTESEMKELKLLNTGKRYENW